MSGKKRALVGLDAHLAARLVSLETRLGSVQEDFQSVQGRISAMRAEEDARAQTMYAARQQALHEALSGVEDRFLALDAHTTAALARQEMQHASHARRFEADLNQANTALNSLTYELAQQRAAAQDAWRNAQETLEAAKALEQGLCDFYPQNLWKTAQPRIHIWLDESEANLYRGQDEAALVAAQQAYLDLQELRFSMEAHFRHQHRLRISVIQSLNEVLALAEANASVQALDLDGTFLNTWIDVNQWSAGYLGRVHARARALLNQLSSHATTESEPDWRELLEEHIPSLEQGVCDAVRQARQAVFAAQLRFNIAERVVSALEEQGYALAENPRQALDTHSYRATLRDYSGSQVSVSISPVPPAITTQALEPAFQLEISYGSQVVLSDHILRRSVDEIYATLRTVGLNVASLSGSAASEPAPKPAPLPLAQRRAALHILNP